MTQAYEPETLQRSDVDQLPGAVVVDFGTNWCGHCQAARPLVDRAFEAHAEVKHIKIEDGSGRRLGRSFGVKLWPTLVFLRDGKELARLVRPTDPKPIADALDAIAAPGASS